MYRSFNGHCIHHNMLENISKRKVTLYHMLCSFNNKAYL